MPIRSLSRLFARRTAERRAQASEEAAACEPLESRTLLASTPIVRIAVSDASAAEYPRDIGEFTITRTGAIDNPLTVRYQLSAPGDGSSGSQSPFGENGVDYIPLDAQVTIPAGRRSTTLPIIPIDDLTVEGDESVRVTLLDDGAYDVDRPGPTRSATVTIVDDDVKPMVTLHRPDAWAGEVGQDTARFIIKRTGPRNLPLTVQLSTSGSATPGVDYEPLPTSVTIRPGRGRAVLYVRAYNDTAFEGDESVRVTLTAPSDDRFALNLFDSSQVSTYAMIRDRPTVTITVADPTATTDPSDTGAFRITRTGPTTQALRVAYFLGGTATVGIDFIRLADVITIPAGRSSVLVTIRGRGTQFDTPHKNVNLTLRRLPTYNLDHTDPGLNIRQVRIWDDRLGLPG